jgi:dTDP-glucose 4,6-dehydratase
MSYTKNIFITGGAGFIGSHLVRRWIHQHPDHLVVNIDALTYAGNLENLQDVKDADNYRFEHVDICDRPGLKSLFEKYKPQGIIHLAAESHVDRSISNPLSFVETNVIGTVNLLNESLKLHKAGQEILYYQVSTDEVYGSLGSTGLFTEKTCYDPRSPYSASKASADHFVRAYGHTYGLPVVLSNCSNNYGPYQFPEKLIPLMINNIKNGKTLPVYGDGSNIRDWLWVDDHARAIDLIFQEGREGETYNIGGNQEYKNLDLVYLLCDIMDEVEGRVMGESRKLIQFVKDRPGHDQRYAIDASKIESELGWRPSLLLKEGLERTVKWYLSNTEWLHNVTSGAYKKYYEEHYEQK